MVRVVVEIPKAFAAHCGAIGDNPRDVILDLIDELLDEQAYEPPAVQVGPPPPAHPEDVCRLIRSGRGLPEIAEFLRERGEPA